MSYCIKPRCGHTHNPDGEKVCLNCGTKLLLRERYSPRQEFGKGGFGRIFLAIDEDIPSKPTCIIKQFHCLNQDAECLKKAMELFAQEAVHLDELGQHPQIPELLAYFEQEHHLYLVEEYIDGLNLEEELQQQGIFDESKIWELLENLLPVLHFIHEKKVIHRDIKPENIIRRSSDRQLFLIDFGVAKLLTDSGLHRTGTIIGSHDYISPEQSKGKALPASDLYSLGVTCVRLLTKRPLGDMYDINEHYWWWRNNLPKQNPVSDRLAQILDKLIACKISQRYQSALEVLEAIYSDDDTQNISTINQSEFKTFLPPGNHLSQAGVDYTNLQRLLAAKKWQEADRETWKVMCQALGKPQETLLENSEITQLPCEDLQLIDQLWVNYSQGRFGFSVQKQIFESVKGDYISFCDRVNWSTYNSATFYKSLIFSDKAAVGHLPSRIWAKGTMWHRHAAAMSARLAKCGIKS